MVTQRGPNDRTETVVVPEVKETPSEKKEKPNKKESKKKSSDGGTE